MSDVTVHGEVKQILVRKEDSDWSLMRIYVHGEGTHRLVEGITFAQVGQIITATGVVAVWNNEARIKAHRITASNPISVSGITSYLSSGVIQGLGPKKAQKMVDAFGLNIIDILDHAPHRLKEIQGFGDAIVDRITQGWNEQKTTSEIMIFLHNINISSALCRRIYKEYKEKTIEVIQSNPYRLAIDVQGIGFKIADAIAHELAIPLDSPQRILAGLIYTMRAFVNDGHCGQRIPELLNAAQKLLTLNKQSIINVLEDDLADRSGEAQQFVQNGDIVSLKWLAYCEDSIASKIKGQASAGAMWASKVTQGLIDSVAGRKGMTLAKKQAEAVKMALTSRICVITGGPGVGKTSTLNVILGCMSELDLNVKLAAPTGKAAQRAAEATGMTAKTLHRLFGLKGTKNDEVEAVKADVIVVDEFSMVDVPLMHSVMKGWISGASLIMVGDVDQLPSVGPGRVLGDIIQSGSVPVTILDEVFRQAQGSLIIRNAHEINKGHMPQSGKSHEDFFMMTGRNTPEISQAEVNKGKAGESIISEVVANIINDIVVRRLPEKYGFNPLRDIQVLCPMNKGSAGVIRMNTLLQSSLNDKPKEFIKRFANNAEVRFGLGDRVMQTRNNYDIEIFNGETGYIQAINKEESILTVIFDGHDNIPTDIPFSSLDDVVLAYALTIHKSQGSQFPVVIIPMVTESYPMLQRNLLYTGVTRGVKMVILVGQDRAIQIAVNTVPSKHRITRLGDLLRDEDAHAEHHQEDLPYEEMLR